MLKSPDVVLRVVGATTAALGSARSAAHVGLRHTLVESDAVCFNASDPADQRASAIRQWEQWWKANQGVKQQFW